MKITLKSDQAEFVRKQVTQGRYPDVDAVVSRALALLQAKEQRSQPDESPNPAKPHPERQITVVSANGEVTVPISTFVAQVPELANLKPGQVTFEQACRDLRQALKEGGYHSREDIVGLVRDVKQEMQAEREANEAANA